ncbi:MAG: amidohydrolase [Spirochaetales bacterium]|nr:amidohydrolase [Spirochaetales bacterium]
MSDLILKSSNIFTSADNEAFPGALVIRNGKIDSVLRGSFARSDLPSSGDFFDCGSRLIMPGFCDSHIHGFLGSLQSKTVNLADCVSEEDAALKTKRYYETSDLPRLIGFGWNHYSWAENNLPSKHSLDRLIKDKPVYLFNEELHSIWLNSAALKEAGITKTTPQPENGHISIGKDGEPSGYLLEPGAIELVTPFVFSLTPEAENELFQNLIDTASACGITSFSDIQIFDTLNCGIYEQFLKNNELSCRVFPVFPMKTPVGQLLQLRDDYDSDFLKFSGVKEFLDGTAAMYTGTLIEPYSDRPGFNAPPLVEAEKTIERAIELDQLGFRIRFHACGAGAVRLGLDIFEQVRKKNGFNATRHTIEHIENIAPVDIPRFKALGVTASVQPDHLWSERYANHPFHSILGPERCRWAWPFKSLVDGGADTAFGTDFPVSPLDPMQGIYRAMTRLHEDGKPEGGWIPEEKLGLSESLRLYTAGSAKQMYSKNQFGMLKPGMAADIAVIDGNLFDMSPGEIRQAGIYMTISAGRIVYS